MRKVPIYFDGSIPLFDVMRAAESIGCTVRRDTEHPRALSIVRRSPQFPPTRASSDVIELATLPAFLRRQGE